MCPLVYNGGQPGPLHEANSPYSHQRLGQDQILNTEEDESRQTCLVPVTSKHINTCTFILVSTFLCKVIHKLLIFALSCV